MSARLRQCVTQSICSADVVVGVLKRGIANEISRFRTVGIHKSSEEADIDIKGDYERDRADFSDASALI